MMQEKGFTLIELLAVIIILAIITLIAIPIVLNIIEDSKKTAMIQTSNQIIKAANLYYHNKELKGERLNKSVEFKFPGDMDKLNIQGQISGEGEMIMLEDQKIALVIKNEKYCITKAMDNDELIIQENYEECNLPDAVKGIMTSKNYCILDGICENGTLINVKVNDTENYNFYVINDLNDELTLIMDRNIGENIYWSYYYDTTKGPFTALQALKKSTDNWTNLTKLAIDQFEYDNDIESNLEQTYEMYARLPKYSEINSIVMKNGGVLPKYLYENLVGTGNNSATTYWTSTAHSTYTATAWQVGCTGAAGPTCYGGYGYSATHNNITSNPQGVGIRPVITIYK